VALAADVRRHLEGRAVLARGDGPAYRLRKWAHRHRATAVAVAVGMATGIGVIAASVGSDAPGDAPGDVPGLAAVVSTPSSAAARAYRDGLRAFARGNWGEATRQFQSALAEDSTFALAALYASESAERDGDYALSRRALDRAVRLAGAAPERDRLVVRAYQAHRLRLPAVAAYADSLVRRWPDAVEGPVYAARAAFMAGDFARSRAMWRRAASMDSLSLVRGLAPCFACEARQQLVNVHIHMDSLDAAEREARVLLALLPDAASSWRYLAMVHALRGDEDETAYRRAVELDPGNADYAAEWLADRRIRRGDFASAEEVLRGRMATAPADREERSLGLLITALRNQARWTEALALARRFRTLAPDGPPAPDAPAGAAPSAALHEAQVLFESGHPREAAALFDSVGLWTPDVRGFTPGHRIWHLAHAADALAAAGDTARLDAIADTIGALAPRSGYARDARLEHHVRGLLHAARGDDDAAVAAFRRAVYSPNMGYTRTNHELARALLRLGRPREAVAALQPALRGSLEVNNTHITHAELHAALAAAWDAAGDADSAAAHRAWVAGARRHGEPRLARTDAPTGARLVPGAARRVAFDAGLELDPALAPDGARVAYASEAGGAMRLHVRPTAGGPGVALATTVPGDHRAPRWSPDGRTLAFQADGRIYAVPSAGGAA
jgi:tetratricopeptide (TPR) repeat protein